MSHLSKTSTETSGGENDSMSASNDSKFIGKEILLEKFYRQLNYFEEWNDKRDWLAFHHHHYDWWMFPIDEISSQNATYQLTDEVLNELRGDKQFIAHLRRGVKLMVSSWGWDIDQEQLFSERDDKQNGHIGLFDCTKQANVCGYSIKLIIINH